MSFESLKDDLKNPEDAGNGLKSSYSGFYEFGDFRLDAAKRLLLREGVVVPLTPKAFDVLLLLVSRQGHVVGKDEILSRVWPDTIVEENNLNVNVSLLRKTLGEKPNDHQFIVTVPGFGYQFVAGVRFVGGENSGAEARRPEASNSSASRPQHIVLVDEAATKTASGEVVTARPTSNTQYLASEIRRHKSGVVFALGVVIIVIAALTFGWHKLASRNQSSQKPAAPLQTMKIARLTSNGKATHAAISPDGKYLVHVVEDAGRQSLWLRQVTTTSDEEIVRNCDCEYGGLTFSRDGNYVYFTRGKKIEEYGELYRMSMLGGAERKVIENIDSPITFSPDGKRLAFVRGYPRENEYALIVANSDGTGERRLAGCSTSVSLEPMGPAWSPDGRVIAWVNDSDADGLSVFAVRVEDGRQTLLSSHRWSQIGRLAWQSDGNGLIMTAADQESAPSQQIWQVSYPSGEARSITTDLNDYQDVTLTADSTALVAVRSEQLSNIWTTAPHEEENRAMQVTSNNIDGVRGISWTPDGKIIYASSVSGNDDIWIMNADGRNQTQLTTDAHKNNDPTVSSDGRYIVFVSDRTGQRNLWRMERDGRNATLLTNNGAGRPNCSPDGRWVVYASDDGGKPRISKVSIDGGVPLQLTNHTSGRPMISPDGKQIVCGYFDDSDEQNSRWKYAIIPIEGGEAVKMFDIPPTVPFSARFIWSPDRGTLTYIDQHNGVSNIWSQAIDGSPPKQLTNFKSGLIFQFAWSSDGKWLALARGTMTSDVVMIKDFR